MACYLDQFTFRFHRRKSKSRGKLFYSLVRHVTATDPQSFEMLVEGVASLKRRRSEAPEAA